MLDLSSIDLDDVVTGLEDHSEFGGSWWIDAHTTWRTSSPRYATVARPISSSGRSHERVQRQWSEQDAQRGRQLASVVVEVFEHGDAVPQVQFAPDSPIGPGDTAAVADAVRRARDALGRWQ